MAYLGNAPTSVPLSSADILDSAITSAKIANGAVVAADIADGTITAAKFATGAVSSDYVLLATTDITSSTASVSFDGYYSSTYKNYKLIIANLSPVSISGIRFRFRRSNADVTATNYTGNAARGYYRQGAGAGTDSQNNTWAGTQSYGVLFEETLSATSSQATHGEITIFDPLSTGYKKHISYQIVGYSDAGYAIVYNGICFHNENNNAMSGITLFPSTGNIVNGNFKLYGIK